MLEAISQWLNQAAATVPAGEFHFQWPQLLWLLPAPLLGLMLPPARPLNSAAVPLPFARHLQFSRHGVGGQRWWWRLFVLLLWGLLLLAAARPQFVGEIEKLPVSGRDLMMAVDISGSMATDDMVVGTSTVSRMRAVQVIGGEFIERRAGDRLGLILFGEQAYLQVPLTFDRQTTASVLRDAEVNLAGRRYTAIGDAIGLALKRLQETPNDRQVLVLLTDGVNNGGVLQPLQVAEFARDAGMKIYTIGIGADRMRVSGLLGSRMINPSADLDEDTLREVASMTGGQYFRARDPESLNQIYAMLDELEPLAEDEESIRPVSELFYWPLGALLLLTLAAALAGSMPHWRRAPA
ncbi:MAG: VWA domain-containing protein [Wenzhouxiangellaceae bacterium]